MREKSKNEWDQHFGPHSFQADACTVVSSPQACIAAAWEKTSILADGIVMCAFLKNDLKIGQKEQNRPASLRQPFQRKRPSVGTPQTLRVLPDVRA